MLSINRKPGGMVRRYAANLEGKSYLQRYVRIGSTNSFDLNPLFAALAAALEREKATDQSGVVVN